MQTARKREIRIEADSFRKKCTINRYGIADLFQECENCGARLIRYPAGDDTVLGFVLRKDNDIIIYTNTGVRLSREWFTLAHEIGHVLLHLTKKASFIDDPSTLSMANKDEWEQEANYFAACLLMPGDEVDRFLDLEVPDFDNGSFSSMDIAKMMSAFSVSFEMVLNRLENLGKISLEQKLRLDTERMQTSVGNLLRSVGGNARLNTVSKDTNIPREYLDYAIYNYNHNAIPKETLERTLAYYHLRIEDINDRIIVHPEETEDDLDELIGGLVD